jgi:hypothetical protein
MKGSIQNAITKMMNASGGINQHSHLLCLQVMNLDDLFNIFLETQ